MTVQLKDLCEDRGVVCVPVRSTYAPIGDDWPAGSHHYKVTLTYQGREAVFAFHQGPANTKPPTAADVLYCLCSDATAGEQSFEDFCSEFGYDSDSRKAYATWEACKAAGPKVRALLGDDFELFATAEH